MKKKYIAVALLLCSSLVFTACGKKEDPNAQVVAEVEPAAPVQVLKVEKTSIENQYTYNGKVKPVNEVQVLSTVGGKVASVNYDVGDIVNAGDVLFTMDTADIRNQINVLQGSLQSIEANISSARTNVELVNGASMQSQIESAKAALNNAELAYNNAELTYNNTKTTYENNKTLYESNVISKTAFDQSEMAFKQSETGLKQAELAYNQAKESYDIIANQMPEENLKKAQEALKVAEASKASILAQIASSEKSLRDAVVTSPISGIVTACNVKPATVLSQSTSPFTIIDTSAVDIDVNVSEQIINSLSPGQIVSVKVAAASAEALQGTIRTINPAASEAGTYEVKVEIPNGNNILKSGMFGEVSFTREKSENTIVLPRNTVVSKNGETYVFVEDNGVAKKVPVTLGVDNGDQIEILSGIEQNMNVIIKGQTYLEDGDKVQIASNDSISNDADTPDSSENENSSDASDTKEE